MSTWHKKASNVDIDWSHDEVLFLDSYRFCYDRVKSTFFVTYNPKLLEHLANDHMVTLGIHPNFQPLLRKSRNSRSVKEEIKRLMKIVQNVICSRSHGVIRGDILQEMSEQGVNSSLMILFLSSQE